MEEVFGKIAELMLAVSKASVELTDTKQRDCKECLKNYNSLEYKYNKIVEDNDRMFTMMEKIQHILFSGMYDDTNKIYQLRELLKDV